MEKNLKQEKNFITISACLFLLYAFVSTNLMVMIWGKVLDIVFSIVYLVVGVGTFVSINRTSIATTISMGLAAVANLIPLLFVCYFMIVDFAGIGILWMILMGSRVACFVLLTMNSIIRSEAKELFLTLPVILQIIYTIICIGVHFWYSTYVLGIIRFLIGEIVVGLGIFFFSKALHIRQNNIENETLTKPENTGYCDMTKHVLLLVFIGWIWQYIWIYRTTDFLNKTPNEEKRDPATKLLLCMFVPFYYIYWIYQSARRIEILAKERNIDSDIVTLSVVLSLFVGIVPPIIMQSKLNQICKTKDKNTITTETSTIQQKIGTNCDKTDEIRNYKKLLDDGIITEEEFEAKKKQLLEL